MEKTIQQHPPQTHLDAQQVHRGNRYGKKKRSIVSMILHFIVLILVGVIGFSMYREPLLNVVILNQPVNFQGLSDLQNLLAEFSNLNLDDLQEKFDLLIMIFYIFFGACIVSLILTLFTIIFNRTLLKIFNLIVVAVIFVVPFAFSAVTQNITTQFSNKLGQLYLSIPGDQILIATATVKNAYILAAATFALLFIALFFRNRRPKIHIK